MFKTMGKLNPGELQEREEIRKWNPPGSGGPDPDLYGQQFMPGRFIKYRRSKFDAWNSWYEFQMENGERRNLWYPNIKQGDVVVDAGASWGSYCLPAAVLGAETHAFEPDTRIFADLLVNIQENNLTNITASRFGLSNSTRTIEWEETPEMQLIRLDDYGLRRLDFLKLDIEGFEYEALQGAQELIKKYHPKLLVEVHLMYDTDLLHKIATFVYSQADGYQLTTNVNPQNMSTVCSYFWFEPKKNTNDTSGS